jgi:hypothetical protein
MAWRSRLVDQELTTGTHYLLEKTTVKKNPVRRGRRTAATLGPFLLICLLSGCSDGSRVGPTFPVSGKITFMNEPLVAKNTIILLRPDAARGNNSSFEPTGTVDSSGTYTLRTEGKTGAPPGWYKVVVTARDDAQVMHPKAQQNQRPLSKSLVPAKYGQERTTDLAIEVVETPPPGAYDLKLTN